MDIKKNFLRGLALYGASTMTTTPSMSKQMLDTIRSIENDAR
ncbi:hypothetical protein [Bifidobacterium pluvialisilvae]|nr:hypothetical protein [Bifidobacterium pluvialisilvae]